MHEDVPDECRPVVFKDGVRLPFPAATRLLKRPKMRSVHGCKAATRSRVESEPVEYHPGAVQAPSQAKVGTTRCLQAPHVFCRAPEHGRETPAAERLAARGKRRESALLARAEAAEAKG